MEVPAFARMTGVFWSGRATRLCGHYIKTNIMEFFEAVGWLGNVVLSISVIPQVWKTYKSHDVSSFSWSFILMWCGGVMLTFVYIAQDNIVQGNFQWPLWLNYIVNIVGTTYLVYAKIKFTKEEVQRKKGE